MFLSLIYITYSVLFFTKDHSGVCNNQRLTNTDTTFINWNKATLGSLDRQIKLSKEISTIFLYKNRKSAFKAFVEIDNAEKLNANSIRYQFLQQVMKDANNKKAFYIIEANRSGEVAEIRNYVIYPNNTGKADIDIYNFSDGKWLKSAGTERINFGLSNSLNVYRTKFTSGFNQDDVIITRFVNNAVIASEFYLYTTLSDVGNIKAILSLR